MCLGGQLLARAAGGTGHEIVTTADPDIVRDAERIVLPGVGAFADCMNGLKALPGMVDALEENVRRVKKPFLGICVGMQLMAERGLEYGTHAGLGWIGGEVRRIEPGGAHLKVPHMGWNQVTPLRPHPLIEPGEAYFLHSYAFTGDDVIATTEHGVPVTAAIGRDNWLGVQFHPEKSQESGLKILKNFCEL